MQILTRQIGQSQMIVRSLILNLCRKTRLNIEPLPTQALPILHIWRMPNLSTQNSFAILKLMWPNQWYGEYVVINQELFIIIYCFSSDMQTPNIWKNISHWNVTKYHSEGTEWTIRAVVWKRHSSTRSTIKQTFGSLCGRGALKSDSSNDWSLRAILSRWLASNDQLARNFPGKSNVKRTKIIYI